MDPNRTMFRSAVFAAALAAFPLSAMAAAKTSDWKTPCNTDPQDHKIDVGAQVSCKLAYISKQNGNTVMWRSIDPNMPNVKIVFADPDAFKNIKDCSGTHQQCNSGLPTGAAGSGKLYDYTASLCDKGGSNCSVVKDPGIIIVP
ncbi:MAG: hypothetical protein ACRD16_01975 [Thermoanaerobaculia bacterium]